MSDSLSLSRLFLVSRFSHLSYFSLSFVSHSFLIRFSLSFPFLSHLSRFSRISLPPLISLISLSHFSLSRIPLSIVSTSLPSLISVSHCLSISIISLYLFLLYLYISSISYLHLISLLPLCHKYFSLSHLSSLSLSVSLLPLSHLSLISPPTQFSLSPSLALKRKAHFLKIFEWAI